VFAIRWYVDADTLGLAHILVQVRRDVTYPGDDGKRRNPRWNTDPCPVTNTEVEDEIWIPQVARAGWAIITRDRHIRERFTEQAAVVAARARMFAITSREQLDKWGILEVVVSQWRAMERAAEEPGPYIYSVTRTSIEKLDLF
jgi:hypothetical protein